MNRNLTSIAPTAELAVGAILHVETLKAVRETKGKWSRRRREFQFYRDVNDWRNDARYPQRTVQNMVPDTVKDSTRKRTREAAKPRGRIEQIEALLSLYGQLQHIIVPLPHLIGAPYYVASTVKAMTAYGRGYLQTLDSHGIVCLRWSRTGVPHLHIVARGDCSTREYSRPLGPRDQDIVRLAEYLCTPVDEAATKVDLDAYLNYTADELGMQLEEAATRWIRAYNSTGGERLPPTSFHTVPGYLLL